MKAILWYPPNIRPLIKLFFSFSKHPSTFQKHHIKEASKSKPHWILSWQSSIHMKTSDLLHAPLVFEQNQCKTKILTAALCILMSAEEKLLGFSGVVSVKKKKKKESYQHFQTDKKTFKLSKCQCLQLKTLWTSHFLFARIYLTESLWII